MVLGIAKAKASQEIGMEREQKRLGRVDLHPDGPIIAGMIGQWTFTYTVGDYGIDEGGTIILVQRTASDWGKPQFERPKEYAYSSARTTGNAKLTVEFQPKRYMRPWNLWCLVMDVEEGFLEPGDKVTLVLGDQSMGSPGIRAQTFVERAHEFRFLVDPTNASVLRPLKSSPICPVVPGEMHRLVCILPTQAIARKPLQAFVKGEDLWGNPIPPSDQLQLKVEGNGEAKVEGRSLTFSGPGTYRVIASSGKLSSRSNPCSATLQKPRYSKFWGDLHAQTGTTVGTGSDEEYFTFARDQARLDFVSHQANDFQVSDKTWKHLNQVIKAFNEPGRFVVFPGYEWSGNTPGGGDYNVIYADDDQPIFRSSHWQVPEIPEDNYTPAYPLGELFSRLRDRGNALLIPHVGGRYADIKRHFCQELTPLVEILSCWGIFEWLLWDALERGYIVGVVCNSDGHKGRPGAEYPGAGMFGIQGGLTCVLAEELTRESIFTALKERRCYGTTGTRIDLSFEMGGRPMGSCTTSSHPVEIRARVTGTAPLEALYLYRGTDIVKTVRPDSFSLSSESRRIRVSWEGALTRGRSRKAVWDGSILVSGTRIINAKTYAFDSPLDGIIEKSPQGLRFKSSTCGDVDGIDLTLSDARKGHLSFQSQKGSFDLVLKDLGSEPVVFDFGGLGLKATVQRYPEVLKQENLLMETTIDPPAGKTTPYFVKAIQEDGHMAWASPIYVTRSHK